MFEFYQLVFANLDRSPANRSLIKSLYGELMKADPETSSEGLTSCPGWAEHGAAAFLFHSHSMGRK